jgi:hypothetical protein
MDPNLPWRLAPFATGALGYLGGILSEPIKASLDLRQETANLEARTRRKGRSANGCSARPDSSSSTDHAINANPPASLTRISHTDSGKAGSRSRESQVGAGSAATAKGDARIRRGFRTPCGAGPHGSRAENAFWARKAVFLQNWAHCACGSPCSSKA